MKLSLIVYVSKATQSASHAQLVMQLSQIFRESRAKNSRANLSGVLTYASGYYFQVIEGEEQSLRPLYEKIVQDSRHSNVQKILDIETNERYFSGFNMKLISSTFPAQTLQSLGKLLRENQQRISADHQRLLAQFNFHVDNAALDDLRGRSIKLSSWPDFGSIQKLPFGIDLTAALVSSSLAYDDLIRSSEFGSRQQIEAILKVLRDSGLLIVAGSGNSASPIGDPKTANGFYSKMKKFLSIR